MKLKLLGMLVVIFLVTACATVDVTKTGKGYYEPTDANFVEILLTVPKRPFEELGTITAYNFGASDTAVLHNEIRAKASPLGADAVIISNQGMMPAPGGPKLWANGVAIKYKDNLEQKSKNLSK